MPQPPMPAMNRSVLTVIRDVHGVVILSVRADEFLIFEADGTVTRRRINESIMLMCGTAYNPAMSMGPNPIVLPAACSLCRRPRLFGRAIHGLCSMERGAICAGCGEFLCPRHARGRPDGPKRCRTCAWLHLIKRVLGVMFFSIDELPDSQDRYLHP